MTMVSGFWFLFFAMASYTHFGSRAQSRGDPNAKLSAREFIKQVNSSLWQSVKFCARSLKISSWLIAFAGYQAGMASVVALSGTYLTGQLHLSTSTTGAVLLYAQFVGIPGALIFYFISSKIGLHQALAVAYGIWLLAIVLAFYLWKDQTTPTGNVWFVMTIFGAAGGAALSLARSAFAGLIPQGREAEFMGLFNFSAKIIAWSGTLLFTAVNEATKSFRYAFVSLGSFFVLALLGQIVAALAPMPDFLTVQAVCEFDAAIDDLPGGREAEFMGLFNFSAKIIAWSGTLLFTAVNEATKSFRYAFVSLGSFFVLALLGQIVAALAPMPDFLTVQAVCEFDAAIDDQLPPPSRAVSSVVT
eukprot:TRINITY_DN8380_c0_g1_i2.p2 TRINITY_DN8380_c0_g1~~TRINITY_DN8380_c0_g1_i2.p2  ORF type:complete len:359 (-),score=73.45 TRINITY_DN8380_c0_g1_i2:78-1154(-)